jgi:hypothetical protein
MLLFISPYFTTETIDLCAVIHDIVPRENVAAIVPFTGWIGNTYRHEFGFTRLSEMKQIRGVPFFPVPLHSPIHPEFGFSFYYLEKQIRRLRPDRIVVWDDQTSVAQAALFDVQVWYHSPSGITFPGADPIPVPCLGMRRAQKRNLVESQTHILFTEHCIEAPPFLVRCSRTGDVDYPYTPGLNSIPRTMTLYSTSSFYWERQGRALAEASSLGIPIAYHCQFSKLCAPYGKELPKNANLSFWEDLSYHSKESYALYHDRFHIQKSAYLIGKEIQA